MTVGVRADASPGPVRVRAAVAALTGGLFLAALDQNVFATTLPTVAGDVGAGSHLFWISTATVLAGTLVMPVLCRVGDDPGRPRVFAAALAVLMVGSALGGLSRQRTWVHQ